jgi:hypothetical protein
MDRVFGRDGNGNRSGRGFGFRGFADRDGDRGGGVGFGFEDGLDPGFPAGRTSA